MNLTKRPKSIIYISLVFAITMLVAAYFLRGTGYSQTVLIILIALSSIPIVILTNAKNRKCH